MRKREKIQDVTIFQAGGGRRIVTIKEKVRDHDPDLVKTNGKAMNSNIPFNKLREDNEQMKNNLQLRKPSPRQQPANRTKKENERSVTKVEVRIDPRKIGKSVEAADLMDPTRVDYSTLGPGQDDKHTRGGPWYASKK